jgi:hypothetical protein
MKKSKKSIIIVALYVGALATLLYGNIIGSYLLASLAGFIYSTLCKQWLLQDTRAGLKLEKLNHVFMCLGIVSLVLPFLGSGLWAIFGLYGFGVFGGLFLINITSKGLWKCKFDTN